MNTEQENIRKAAKADIFDVLETCPHEVTGLLKKLEAGEVDGSCYTGKCKCLLGTLAELKLGEGVVLAPEPTNGARAYKIVVDLIGSATRKPDSYSPAETWFMSIDQGHTPATNKYSHLAVEWIQEWLESKGMIK